MGESRTFIESNQDKAYILFLLNQEQIKGNIRFVKYIFLSNFYAKKEGKEPPFNYNFKIWHNGPYNKWIQNDLTTLILSGLIKKKGKNNYQISEKGKRTLEKLSGAVSNEKKSVIKEVLNRFKNLSTKELLDYVYQLDIIKSKKFGETIEI